MSENKKIKLYCTCNYTYPHSRLAFTDLECPYAFVSVNKDLLQRYKDSQPYIKFSKEESKYFQTLENMLEAIIRKTTISTTLNILDEVLTIEKYVREKGFSSISEFIEHFIKTELSKSEVCCVNCRNCDSTRFKDSGVCYGFSSDDLNPYDIGQKAEDIYSHCLYYKPKQ